MRAKKQEWERFYTDAKEQNEEGFVDQISIDVINKVYSLGEKVDIADTDGEDEDGNEIYSFYVSRGVFDIILEGLKAKGYATNKKEENAMDKYCIISFVYEGKIVSEYHDLSLDEFERKCKKAKKEAGKKGVELYFMDSYNERIISDSFALVEHNFDLEKEEKIRLVKFITSFFDDWDGWDFKLKDAITINTLKAVRFLRVNGEIVKIK